MPLWVQVVLIVVCVVQDLLLLVFAAAAMRNRARAAGWERRAVYLEEVLELAAQDRRGGRS